MRATLDFVSIKSKISRPAERRKSANMSSISDMMNGKGKNMKWNPTNGERTEFATSLSNDGGSLEHAALVAVAVGRSVGTREINRHPSADRFG